MRFSSATKSEVCTILAAVLISSPFIYFGIFRNHSLRLKPIIGTTTGTNHPQLTVETMLYAKYGLSSSTNSRMVPNYAEYQHYVRTLIARPSSSIPRSTRPMSQQAAEVVNGQAVDKRLKGRRQGFFVECGAGDGFTMSHTLFLELERNWTGLLVEPNEDYFKEILQMNRQAFAFGGCLSTLNRTQYLELIAHFHLSGFDHLMNRDQRAWAKAGKRYRVTCFPLMDLLNAIEVKHIDFFSLDTQGGELAILQTIDFQAIRIDILMIEVENEDPALLKQERNKMRNFFNQTGLYREGRAPHERDMMFERIDL